jgi:hypothetical protein
VKKKKATKSKQSGTQKAKAWSASEERQLKKLYPMSHNSDLAKQFGRSIDGIRKKAIKLGLKKDWAGGYRVCQPPQNENPWTAAQIRQLRKMYLTTPTPEIAAALNRSPMAVQSKIKKLGLYQEFKKQGELRKPKGQWTQQEINTLRELYPVKTKVQIAEIMDRSFHAISRMIHKLQLSTEKPSTGWTAEEDAFLEKHIFEWPVEKIAEALGRGPWSVKKRAWKKQLLKQTQWTKSEIQQLKYWQSKCSREELAEKLGRPFNGVVSKLQELGLKKYKPLTPKETAILRKFFPIETNVEVAKRLGVSPPTVAAKARQLGLRKSIHVKYQRSRLLNSRAKK